MLSMETHQRLKELQRAGLWPWLAMTACLMSVAGLVGFLLGKGLI